VVTRLSLRGVAAVDAESDNPHLLRASITGALAEAASMGKALAAELLDLGAAPHCSAAPDEPRPEPPRTRQGEVHEMTPARKSAGRVAFVGSGPGDPGLITANAQELLAKADLIVTD